MTTVVLSGWSDNDAARVLHSVALAASIAE
jgi:hypothetical protein